MTAAIECRYLKMEFGAAGARQTVLRGVNLTAHAGRLTMIAGPSGCGKSTLLSILGGLLTPTAGEAIVFGRALSAMSARERAAYRREDVGFIFQQYNLVPALTAAENAAVALIIAGEKREAAVARARATLATLGLGEHCEKFPASFPADSSSASRSRARSCTVRASSSATSRRPRSIPRRARR